jgi:hypothetical protein
MSQTEFDDDLAAQAVAGEEDQDQGDPPPPMLAGTFAIYETPDGGYVLVTDTPSRGIERKMIPGKLVRLVTRGPGASMFGRIFG